MKPKNKATAIVAATVIAVGGGALTMRHAAPKPQKQMQDAIYVYGNRFDEGLTPEQKEQLENEKMGRHKIEKKE